MSSFASSPGDTAAAPAPHPTAAIVLRIGEWTSLQSDARAVRLDVFVREQGIPISLEWDERDAESLHCVAYQGGTPIATGRLLPDGHIGRMAVLADRRRSGVGGRLLQRLVQAGLCAGHDALVLSAQQYVCAFYRRHGFVEVGAPYVEADIPHQEMRLSRATAQAMQRVSVEETTSAGRGDATLAVRDWQGSQPSSDGVYILHGLGEHAGRYDTLARWFVERGWRVRAHDHRGHGRSSGRRGTVPDERALVEDALAQVATFAEQLGTAPLLLGHSMGGALAAQVAVNEKATLRGLILSSPALDIGAGAAAKMLARVLGAVAPDLAVGNGLNPRHVSHDAAVVQAYVGDPLVHDRISARLVRWLMAAGPAAIADAGSLSARTLLLVAGDDRLVAPRGARKFADGAPPALLTLRWYDDAWHELFNEDAPRRAAALSDLDAWLRTAI